MGLATPARPLASPADWFRDLLEALSLWRTPCSPPAFSVSSRALAAAVWVLPSPHSIPWTRWVRIGASGAQLIASGRVE